MNWYNCGGPITFSAAASIDVTVSNGIINNSGTLSGTTTNTTLYTEPYVCNNNLANFNITTNLSVGSCAASVTNQSLYLDRLNSATGVWAQGIASTILYGSSRTGNVATLFGLNNLTANNNQNIYRVRGVVTSTSNGIKTFTTPNFRVVSIGAYNVNYFYTNTQGTNITIPTSNGCTSPLSVSQFDAPVISGISNSGIIDKYWISIIDVTTNCQNTVATLDAFNNKRNLTSHSLAEINGLNLETYYRQIKQAQGVASPDLHIFSKNPNRVWKITLFGENICTGATGIYKRSFIINNCLTCRSAGSVDMTKRTIKDISDTAEWIESATVYPNPASKIAIIECVSNEEASVNLTIYDMQGRVINEQKSIVTKGENTISIDISAFTNGMYAFKIGNVSGKFIKE